MTSEPVPESPCPGLRLNSRGVVTGCNEALCRLVGTARTEVEGRAFDALLTASSRVLYQSYLQPLLRMHGHVEEISLSLKALDGQTVDVLLYSMRQGLTDGSGSGDGVEITLAPIRRRRGMEDEMLRIKRAADHAPGLIFQLLQMPDGTQHFPFVSQAVRRLYEVTAEVAHASGEALFSRIVAADRQGMQAAMKAAGDRGENWVGSYRVELSSGETQWHEMQCTPRDLAGGVRVWHGHIADITARRAMETALAERTASERMNAMRGEFLARVSHELRTPLNGIIGFTQLMAGDQASPLAATQADRLSVIAAAGHHLLQLVNQVLDITRIETPETRVELQPLPLAPALDEAFALVRAQAIAARIDLQLDELPPGIRVVASELPLRQVLVNLLANAIKFNREGGRVHVRAEREGSEQVRVSVRDTGIGLSPQQLAQLFEPFNRLGAEARGIEGSGLGLVITRHLLSGMGGRIEVRSEPGEGSTFSILLQTPDLAPAQALPQEPPVPLPLAGEASGASAAGSRARGRVLCVEDNPVNAALMEAILGMCEGITARLVPDGAQALAALADFRPDLLLLDMHLPDMTGHVLLQALRTHAPPCEAPAVMVSAAARSEDIDRALEVGFQAYWTKPLNIDHVLAELDRLLEPQVPRGPA